MPENGFATLKEYRELFDELGQPPGSAKLRRILNRASAQVRVAVDDTLDLYKVIVDDIDDKQRLNLTFVDRRVFKVWGGAFDDGTHLGEPYADRVKALEDDSENALKAALLPGGGVLYKGVLHRIDVERTWERGFTLRGVVQAWLIVTEYVKGIR